MTGKRYYITTLGDWHRHAARFANSHWLALGEVSQSAGEDAALKGLSAEAGLPAVAGGATKPSHEFVAAGFSPAASGHDARAAALDDSTRVLVLVEADEGAHLALEDDAAFEALPHPLAQKPISDAAQAALAAHGVPPGATTFDAAETVARLHPLLRHRVF